MLEFGKRIVLFCMIKHFIPNSHIWITGNTQANKSSYFLGFLSEWISWSMVPYIFATWKFVICTQRNRHCPAHHWPGSFNDLAKSEAAALSTSPLLAASSCIDWSLEKPMSVSLLILASGYWGWGWDGDWAAWDDGAVLLVGFETPLGPAIKRKIIIHNVLQHKQYQNGNMSLSCQSSLKEGNFFKYTAKLLFHQSPTRYIAFD